MENPLKDSIPVEPGRTIEDDILALQTGDECPLCHPATVERIGNEIRCRGECGSIWRVPESEGALEHNGENDYTLKTNHTSCWITVDGLSVYVHRTDEGVVADIFPLKGEADDPLASCYAFFSEADHCVKCGSSLDDANDGACSKCVAEQTSLENNE